MGARTLARCSRHPMLDRAQIEARLDGVEVLVGDHRVREQLQQSLDEMPDLERLAQARRPTAAHATRGPRLAAGLKCAEHVRALVPPDAALAPIGERIDPPIELAEEITVLVVTDPPPRSERVIRPGCLSELDELRSHSTDGRQWLLDLERRERERTGVKNLKVGYNRVFGYYIEVSTAALGQGLDYYRQQESDARTVAELLDRLGYQRRQTLASAERFVTGRATRARSELARSTARMAELEREAFDALCERIGGRAARLIGTATAIAELDTLASFAQVAQEHRAVRPEILETPLPRSSAGATPW